MNHSPPPHHGSNSPSIGFICKACGAGLIVPREKAGISGPCPKCGNWIDGSEFATMGGAEPAGHTGIPATSRPVAKRRTQSVTGGRGRVRADGYLDNEYNERRELFGTLKVLVVSLVVMAVIFGVTLYLRRWLIK